MKSFTLVILAILATCAFSQWSDYSSTSSGVTGSTDYPTTEQASTPLPNGNVDRDCGRDLSNLWLDVVVVVDNSVGMTQNGLNAIAAQVATVFGQGTKIGTNYTDPRNTRVGLVTYSTSAQTVGDLNTYTSFDQFMNDLFSVLQQTSSSTDSLTAKGIGQAETVLTSGRANSFRANYQQAIIIYASDYKSDGNNDPKPIAARLKASGVNIITIAFDQGDESLINQLGELATPGYNFNSKDMNTVGEIQGALLQTNCYCTSLWTQYRADFYDTTSHKYGVCLKTAGLQAGWTPAKLSCQNMVKNGYLATEFDNQKHNFIFQVVQNDTTIHVPYAYHIGLSYTNGGYYWAQPSGWPLLPLRNSIWNPGYPKLTSSNTAVLNAQASSDLTVGWQNISPFGASKDYVCESSSCDTDKYCP